MTSLGLGFSDENMEAKVVRVIFMEFMAEVPILMFCRSKPNEVVVSSANLRDRF